MKKKTKPFIAVALIPDCDLKLAQEALHATTTDNEQLRSYFDYFTKMWVAEYTRGILRKYPEFKPAKWNQFNNAIKENQKSDNSVEGWH